PRWRAGLRAVVSWRPPWRHAPTGGPEAARRSARAGRTHAATRTTGASGELPEEADVRVVEQPDIGNVVARHRDTGRTHTEGPSRPALAVQSRRLEHGRMDEPASHDLEPPRATPVAEVHLHLHLRRGFGEWEVRRAEAGTRATTVEAPGKERERGLEI